MNNSATPSAVELDLSAFGLDGDRKPIDVEATTRAIEPFSQGKANMVISPVGQVGNTQSKEYRDLPRDVQDNMTQLGTMVRSFA